MKRFATALLCGLLFLLPFFGWIAAEPTPYRDPQGIFAFTPPDGWSTDDSGHMGPGLVAKGPVDSDGREPLIHLTHEMTGIVTLEVRWETLLGQMRFDMERLKYLALEERPDATPPYCQASYSYGRGEQRFLALTRIVHAGGRFFLMTATAPEADFEALRPAIVAAFDSFRVGTGP